MTCSEDSSSTDGEADDTFDESSGDEGVTNEATEMQELAEDATTSDHAVKMLKKAGKKNKTVILPIRKVGPQKQKKEIHTCLKKGKKFEIRKLTRRITTLRNLKGTDEQKAKNNRKVEKLLLEIQVMKEFMIDQITERVVDIFKGKCEQIYVDLWNAAQDHKDFEKMLQTLSNGNDSNKYELIAFLRMISSKGILSKLKMVYTGNNIKKPKSKKALQKQLRKYNQKTKKLRKRAAGEVEPTAVTNNRVTMKKNENPVEPGKVLKSVNWEQGPKNKIKQKMSKQVADSFFLPADMAVTNNDTSSDEEFSVPVDKSLKTIPKKKNRMGQRQRKEKLGQVVNTITAKSKWQQRSSRSKQSLNSHKRTKLPEVNKTHNIDKEKLHPSWKAKQVMKSQQSITEFSGTKITFDDDDD